MINIDFNNPEEENWITLVPEHPANVLEWSLCVNTNKLILSYIRDVKSVLQVYNLDDGSFLKEFKLDVGSISNISGRKENSEIFFQFVSFLTPGIIYHYDFAKCEENPTVYKEVKLNLENFQPSAYNVEQIFYDSKDGTRIPMFIVSKKQNEIQPRPCILYGYGGFNISLLPFFSITWLTYIDHFNGVLAIANIRGGG